MREPKSWDNVFMDMAFAASQRSKDPSTQCGAILVGIDRIVLATGFNGPPSTMDDNFVQWDKRPEKYAYIIHAEENCLWTAIEAHGGIRVKGSTIYVTHRPCSDCLLRLIRSKVVVIKYPKSASPWDKTQYMKYQVDPLTLIMAQLHPKIVLEEIPYGSSEFRNTGQTYPM